MAAVLLRTNAPPSDQVVARIGLIADTHMPDRLPALPDTLGVALAGVDMILHAGDVGELRVLDLLGTIAPVVAVHGNDDTLESQRELPYQQLISVGGLRLLLTHAHYPDRQDELVSRRDDSWRPKLDRRAEMGRRAGAQIVVFGHTHVPMSLIWQDTLLINPGAIAPGTHFARQSLMSVARLLVCADGTVAVEYIDLTCPHLPFVPRFDVHAGFQASLAQVNAPIISADMLPLVQPIAALFRPGGLPPPDADTVRDVLRRLAYPRWIAECDPISWDELEAALYHDLPSDLWERTMAIIDAHRVVVG